MNDLQTDWTPSDRELIQQAAEQQGLSVPDYVSQVVLRVAKEEMRPYPGHDGETAIQRRRRKDAEAATEEARSLRERGLTLEGIIAELERREGKSLEDILAETSREDAEVFRRLSAG